jgi:hypothetical protein
MATYTAAGVFHLLRPPRFWVDLGLVAALTSVLAGVWFSSLAVIVDGFILGGFISLVSARALEWLTRACRGAEVSWADLERAGSAKGP